MANEVASIREQAFFYEGNWNPGTIANAGTATTNVTMAGVTLDPPTPILAAFGQALNGANIKGTPIAADTVQVRITNDTGGSLALTTATLTVMAIRLSR